MPWALDTAARTMAMECRGETLAGQVAVAWVMRNRIADGRWGDNIASVCLWHAAFSGWFSPRQSNGKSYRDPNFAYACGLQDDDPVLEHMTQILTEVLAADPKTDPTHSATHYFNPGVVSGPAWVMGDESKGIPPATFCVKIGAHEFYRNVK